MTYIRGAMVECVCKTCGKKFMARVADRKRGWAKCCSKSCAATQTNKKTGNYRKFCELRSRAIRAENSDSYSEHPCSCEGLGQWID